VVVSLAATLALGPTFRGDGQPVLTGWWSMARESGGERREGGGRVRRDMVLAFGSRIGRTCSSR